MSTGLLMATGHIIRQPIVAIIKDSLPENYQKHTDVKNGCAKGI